MIDNLSNQFALVSIGAGISQLSLLKTAKEMGYKIIAIDKNPEAPGFSYASERITLSTYDTQKVLMELSKLKNKYNFIGVIARASGLALYTASAIAGEFNLLGLTKKIVPIATEKAKLREFCKTNDLPVPQGLRIKLAGEIDAGLNMPVIVKPDFSIVGKKDVRLIWDYSNLEYAINSASHSSGNGFVEIEEYIDGFDIACLFWLKKGKARIRTFWDELVGVKKNGLITGLGVSVPSVIIGTDIEKNMHNIVSKFARQFVDVNALLILAFRIDISGNPYITELHADLGGDLIADVLFPNADKNFSYFKLAISIVCNKRVSSSYLCPEYEPTSMLYKGIIRRGKKDIVSSFSDQTILYHSIDLRTNLEKTFKQIRKREMLIIPKHYEWYKFNC